MNHTPLRWLSELALERTVHRRSHAAATFYGYLADVSLIDNSKPTSLLPG